METLLYKAINAALNAGRAIMEVYSSGDFGTEIKSDDSPLTKADKAAHEIIFDALKETGIPILSEEGDHISYLERKEWDELWIVDPLDGTKEFVKRTGEFTVNVALIKNNYPVLGVVFVPVSGIVYYGCQGKSYKGILNDSWQKEEFKSLDDIKKKQICSISNANKLKIVASVSHLSKETMVFASMLGKRYGDSEFTSIGSSLKICQVAEGKADIYPRLGPTMEWDTAAGQAVAENAGACFINWNTKERFDYNRSDLLNNWFVVAGNKISEKDLIEIIVDSGL